MLSLRKDLGEHHNGKMLHLREERIDLEVASVGRSPGPVHDGPAEAADRVRNPFPSHPTGMRDETS